MMVNPRRLGLAHAGFREAHARDRALPSATAGQFQPKPGEANIAAGGRVTDIDLEAFLNAGRRNSERQALLRPIGAVLDNAECQRAEGDRSER